MLRYVHAVVCVAALIHTPAWAQQRPRVPVTAFVDVAVVPMDREQVLDHQTVLVRGDRIIALGPAAGIKVPSGAVQVDGRGKYLIPGLGDMHTHLALSGTAHVEQHLLLWLASGVTTVRNMDYMPNTFSSRVLGDDYEPFATSAMLRDPELLRLRARVASGELLGPRIYTSGPWRVDMTKSVNASVAAYKAAGYDHLKWYREDSVTTDSLAAAVRQVGIPLVGHGMEPDSGGLARTLALGFKSIEHLVPYTADSTLAMQVAATVKAGVWNCLCPGVHPGTKPSNLEHRYGAAVFQALMGAEPDTSVGYLVSGLGAWAAPVITDYERVAQALHAAGAKFLLGTDAPLPVFGLLPTTLHHSLQNVVRIGFTPFEALTLVTRNVAEYFGTLDSTGTIAVGKRADLVLLRGNPLEDIRHVSDIAGVMAAGRWLPQAELERRLDTYYQGRPNVGR